MNSWNVWLDYEPLDGRLFYNQALIIAHNILQFVFLLQVKIHMAYMRFEGFYLAHE